MGNTLGGEVFFQEHFTVLELCGAGVGALSSSSAFGGGTTRHRAELELSDPYRAELELGATHRAPGVTFDCRRAFLVHLRPGP
jgi:hypothetical protein